MRQQAEPNLADADSSTQEQTEEPQDWGDLDVSLRLLDGFELLVDGAAISVQPSAQRLLAYLALRERASDRRLAAAELWPDTSDRKANGNLRSVLWRVQRLGRSLMCGSADRLELAPTTRVDVREARRRARALLEATQEISDTRHDVEILSSDLLPGWWDDWVLTERERFRQLRLHALEALCAALREQGRFPEALMAGLAAVAAEPLRESAQRKVIEVHLAEGNTVEALRQCEGYRRLLYTELGCEPSPSLLALTELR